MEHVKTLILGGGAAGLSVARSLLSGSYRSLLVLEAAKTIGGIAKSFRISGFTFDLGIHGLYSKNDAILAYFAQLLNDSEESVDLIIEDQWQNVQAPHPPQFHLADYPSKVTRLILAELSEAQSTRKRDSEPANFREWCLSHLGKTFSMLFQFPYTRKFWTVEPEELTAGWMGPRVRVPTLQEAVAGASHNGSAHKHYVTKIRYPRIGGFGAYVRRMRDNIDIRTSHRVVRINLALRTVLCANGRSFSYDRLVSSLPLPVMISLIDSTPQQINDAAGQLRWTSMGLVSFGLARDCPLNAHWLYSYDADISFARLSAPSLWAQSNAPPGKSSLQAEVYFRGDMDEKATVTQVIDDLTQLGILHSRETFECLDFRQVAFANVVHDHARENAVALIHEFLADNGVHVCGRYGLWNYDLLDKVVEHGMELGIQLRGNG